MGLERDLCRMALLKVPDDQRVVVTCVRQQIISWTEDGLAAGKMDFVLKLIGHEVGLVFEKVPMDVFLDEVLVRVVLTRLEVEIQVNGLDLVGGQIVEEGV